MTTQTQPQAAPSPNADSGRYSLSDSGQILWQENATNPLPGKAVGKIVKGKAILAPEIEAADPGRKAEMEHWLAVHIRDVLAVLFALRETEGENVLEGPATEIGKAVYDHLGVIHRSEIEKWVPDLTPEHRAALRRKRVKMGPVLVFMPDLVKPAAIHLRALLWGLWNGKTLPMDKPADGRVSVTVDPETADRHYYRSIGYPVFGPKAIRIDMLDRVITDIYDSAKDWQFQAKHQYAEWLGCHIDDLYAVLESLGHRRIIVKESESPFEPEAGEKKAEESEEKSEEKEEKKDVKPELAFFRLKKGKISERPKPYKKPEQKTRPERERPKNKEKTRDKGPRIISAKPAGGELDNDDSPFAILKQLKKN